jgi:hypothetical protein
VRFPYENISSFYSHSRIFKAAIEMNRAALGFQLLVTGDIEKNQCI